MKDHSSPASQRDGNESAVSMRPLSFVSDPVMDGQSANASLVRESTETFFLELRGTSNSGIGTFRHCTAQSLLSCLPGDRTAPHWECMGAASSQTDSKQDDIPFHPREEVRMNETRKNSLDMKPSNGSSGSMAPDPPPSSSTPSSSDDQSSRQPPSVLVIDDEFLDMELIADILGADYLLLFANDGIAGLEIAANKSPDLILLDVMMPGIDGYEVYKRLRDDPRTCDIPVIFITGLGDVAAETRGLTLGAVDYIMKPINPEPVKARVNTQIKLKLERDKLAQLASTDGLTGLANRSYFDAMLAYECARHARSGSELSLIMLDIDHFKAYNDTYGHVSGDDCLREIAHAITGAAVRATDIVARYGGEEFVLLLPETHLQGAMKLAEKIRKCISDLAMPHEHSEAKHVTASLGVASARMLPGSVIVDIVEEADRQLYVAKAAGRNRVASREFTAAT